MAVKIHIALLVQEGMKDHLQKLANDHKTVLSNNYIVSTKGTADYLHENTEIAVTEIVNSGEEGGDRRCDILAKSHTVLSALSRCLCIDAGVQLQEYPSCNEYENG
jgi:methylglyoxal synthase